MDEYKILTAKDARKLVEESNFLIKSLYKWIREESTRNHSQLILNPNDFDNKSLKDALLELKCAGYTVDYKPEMQGYIITW